MAAIHIRTTLDSVTPHLPELGPLVGRVVDIVVSETPDPVDKTKQFWDEVNAGYAALRADPQAWAEEQADRTAMERTLMDGLDPTERWNDDGTEETAGGGR